MGYIESVRKKPYHARVRIIITILITATVLLIGLWVSTAMMHRKKPDSILHTIQDNVDKSRDYWKNVLPPPPQKSSQGTN